MGPVTPAEKEMAVQINVWASLATGLPLRVVWALVRAFRALGR